jgi:putative RNA 2'-phosphotransferase
MVGRIRGVNEKRKVRVSKRLSLHLRHAPGDIGLELGPGGWVAVDDLLAALARNGFPVDREELAEVVASSDKQRFAIDETGTMIRANQGHSVAVDLELAEADPPDVLFHGTVAAALPAIRREGLRPMARHHVHLSDSADTATRVGARRGKPLVLEVDTSGMRAQGHRFFRSANGVWLVDAVPPEHLREPVRYPERPV